MIDFMENALSVYLFILLNILLKKLTLPNRFISFTTLFIIEACL